MIWNFLTSHVETVYISNTSRLFGCTMNVLVSTSTLHTYIVLSSTPIKEDQETRPIILAFTIDVSGSMSERIPNTKKKSSTSDSTRLEVVIDCMDQIVRDRINNGGHQGDIIVVVVYSGSASLIIPAAPLMDWSTIYERLHQIKPSGYTNISMGNDVMVDQLQTLIDVLATPPHTILLVSLTDGHANEGVQDVRMISSRHAKKLHALRRDIIIISAFYAISSGADEMFAYISAQDVGSVTSVWRHIHDEDIVEFSGELGTLASLVKLTTLVEVVPSEYKMVVSGVWCVNTVHHDTITTPVVVWHQLGDALLNCINHVDSTLLRNILDDLDAKSRFVECVRQYGISESDTNKLIYDLQKLTTTVSENTRLDTGILRRVSSQSSQITTSAEDYKDTYIRRYLHSTKRARVL